MNLISNPNLRFQSIVVRSLPGYFVVDEYVPLIIAYSDDIHTLIHTSMLIVPPAGRIRADNHTRVKL
jgi:hypothetical protein